MAPRAARSATRPGCGKTAMFGGEPAWVLMTMSCSKLSEPE
jgi:hypothetical protein